MNFVVGDGLIKEKLEDWGIRKDIDLLLNNYNIDKIDGGNVYLNMMKDDLTTIMQQKGHLEDSNVFFTYKG
ncbi:MAG: hypothetical protein ACXAE3_17230 [Candidatus Kariarchaeaceae archaeon]